MYTTIYTFPILDLNEHTENGNISEKVRFHFYRKLMADG